MGTVLDKIVAHKRVEIDRCKRAQPFEMLEERLADAPPVRDFTAALSKAEGIGLIAEIKRASPSAGILREDFDAVAIAEVYARHAAACISVLTDEQFFQGRLEFLSDVRQAVELPLLRKDFLLDRYQVLEARLAGADCVLLIAECLDEARLRELFDFAAELGMQSLVEFYEPENVDMVLDLAPPLVGINNRNLKTFETNLEHSIRMSRRFPPGTLVVSESGIHDAADVERLQQAGIQGMLVGETLMRSSDIGARLDELLGNR
jgi:indole-3-glycerol phosphate synthase